MCALGQRKINLIKGLGPTNNNPVIPKQQPSKRRNKSNNTGIDRRKGYPGGKRFGGGYYNGHLSEPRLEQLVLPHSQAEQAYPPHPYGWDQAQESAVQAPPPQPPDATQAPPAHAKRAIEYDYAMSDRHEREASWATK